MTQQIAVSDDVVPASPSYGDAFVVFAVTVVSCAIGAWMLLRVGLELWVGSVAALCIYAALLLFHLLVRRSLAEPATAAVPASAAPPVRRKVAMETKVRQPPAEAALAEPSAPKLATPPPQQAKAAPSPETPPAADVRPQPRGPSLFDFRPMREPSLPPAAQRVPLSRAPQKEPMKSAPVPPTAPPSPLDASQPEISLDFVEESIKKLADALNTAAASGRAAPPAESEPSNEADIDRSIAALRSAARTMKTPAAKTAAPPPAPDAAPPLPDRRTEWWPAMEAKRVPPTQATGAPPVNPKLARLAEAVAAERVEVLLEPIHALTEGRPRHFEVSMRLLTADGTAMEQDEYVLAAREAGLMPRIDAAKMLRAARVAGRLGQRGREGAVLTSLTTESIVDKSFLEVAAARPRGAGGMGLVLSFAQSEVRAFTPGHARALADLMAVGFRFGLRDVTDLDMDFAALGQLGFMFVELDAPVFLEGLPAPGGHVPAADITRHLSDFGFSLIVGRIDDDWLLARVLGFGVVFGKGGLFGGPGRVKDEVVAPSSAA